MLSLSPQFCQFTSDKMCKCVFVGLSIVVRHFRHYSSHKDISQWEVTVDSATSIISAFISFHKNSWFILIIIIWRFWDSEGYLDPRNIFFISFLSNFPAVPNMVCKEKSKIHQTLILKRMMWGSSLESSLFLFCYSSLDTVFFITL